MHRYYLPNDICIILQFKFKPNDFCEQWTQRLQWMESILFVDAFKFCCSLSYKLARSIAIAIFRLPNPYQSLVLLQMKTIYVDFGQQFYYFCLVFLTNVYAKYWNRFVGTTEFVFDSKSSFLLMKRILGKRFTVQFVEISSATAHIYGECVMEWLRMAVGQCYHLLNVKQKLMRQQQQPATKLMKNEFQCCSPWINTSHRILW